MFAARLLIILLNLTVVFTVALPSNYQDLSADDKQRLLWKNVISNPYSLSNLPTDQPSVLTLSKLFNPIYDRPSFVTESDEIPYPGREKFIHTYGSVAEVELRITQNSSFTGIFRSGGIGLARLSLARQNDANFIPGNIQIFVESMMT